MKTVTLTLLLVISALCFSGELKTVKKYGNTHSEIFTIDKKTKLKEGLYLSMLTNTKDTLAIGNYDKGNRTGVWKFYAPWGQPYIEYDYTKQEIIFQSEEINETENFIVNPDTAFILTKVERPPVYLGDKHALTRAINDGLKIPKEIMEKGLSKTGYFSIIIDATGKISNIITEKKINREFDKRLTAIFQDFSTGWLPAIFNGQAVDSKISFMINITNKEVTKKYDEKPYFQVISIVYFSTVTTFERVVR